MVSRTNARWLPPVLSAIGLLLLVVTAVETAVRIRSGLPMGVPFVAGLVTSLPFALLLVVGGTRLGNGVVSVDRYPRIGGWTAAGTVFFTAFFAIIAVFLFSALWNRVGVIRWSVAVGAGGGFLIGVTNGRSIDRAVAAERAAIRAEEAEERRELLEYLNALLRHEVLNSVTAIEGHADLLASDAPTNEEVQERIDVIHRQTDSLTRVIEDVRLLLDVTDGRDRFHSVDLVAVLENELDCLCDQYESVTVERDLHDRMAVRADGLVRRLFGNLFENAVEHNDSDRPRVSVTTRRDGEFVIVEIDDNGPGLPDGIRENLFSPTVGMRADHGLGLAIVDRLAERYGGEMTVTEADSDGTTIEVVLPRADEASPESDEDTMRSPVDG